MLVSERGGYVLNSLDANLTFICFFWLYWVFISLFARSGGYSPVVVCRLLSAVVSFVTERGL